MPRRSKVYTLPPKLKAELERILVEGAHDGYVALAEGLKKMGHDISKSSIHRYHDKVTAAMTKVKATAEFAAVMKQIYPEDDWMIASASGFILDSELLDLITCGIEAANTQDPEKKLALLSKAAQIYERLTRSRAAQKKSSDEMRARIDEAARAAQKEGKKIDQATLKEIKGRIYGQDI